MEVRQPAETPRTFTLFQEGSVADPAHVIAMVETHKEGYVEYTCFEPLKELIHKIEMDLAWKAGYNEALNDALSVLGVTMSEFIRRRNADD